MSLWRKLEVYSFGPGMLYRPFSEIVFIYLFILTMIIIFHTICVKTWAYTWNNTPVYYQRKICI